MELERDLQYLWKPKKTLRDWGKTEYRIIRNWTPHGLKPATTSASTIVPLSSQNKQSSTSQSTPQQCDSHVHVQPQQSEAGIPIVGHISYSNETNEQGLPLMNDDRTNIEIQQAQQTQDNLSEDQSMGHKATSNLLSLSPHVSEHIRTSLLSLKKLRSSNKSRHSNNSGSDHGCISHDSAVDSTKTTTLRTNDAGGIFPRDEDFEMVGDSETEEEHLHVPSINGGMVLDEQRDLDPSSGDERVKTITRSGSERVKDADSGKRVIASEDEEDSEVQSLAKRKSSKTGKRRKHTVKTRVSEPDSHTVKLWQPKHVSRSKGNLNELDVCLTVYDRIIQEKLRDCADNTPVQTALVNHWKHTRHATLRMIKDIHTVQALDKRYKQEMRKQRKLQQEMSKVLSTLRKSNKKYHSSLLKSREMKRKHEVECLQNEIDVLTQQLQPILSHD